MGVSALVAAVTAAVGLSAAPLPPTHIPPPPAPSERELPGEIQDSSGAKVDPNFVYYGNPKRFRRPATVTLSTIFAQIPAYQELKDQGLTQADADYFLLLNKANAAFQRALGRVLEVEGYDLVVEVGAIKYGDPSLTRKVPDITDLVLEELKKG